MPTLKRGQLADKDFNKYPSGNKANTFGALCENMWPWLRPKRGAANRAKGCCK